MKCLPIGNSIHIQFVLDGERVIAVDETSHHWGERGEKFFGHVNLGEIVVRFDDGGIVEVSIA